MDQQQLQQKIAEYFSKLPPNAQEYFAKMDWMNTLQTIATKYQLDEQQIASLGTETTLLLLGIIHPDEYTVFLKKDISMEEGASIQMFKEIDTQIIGGLRGDLAETQIKNSIELANKEYGGGMNIDKRLISLPEEIQDAIVNSDYQTKLYSIASKYQLSIKQIGLLENITNKVMLGILHPDEYSKNINENLGIPNDKASNLVNEVNENIFKNIRDILKNYIEINKSTPEAPKPPYVSTPPVQNLSTPNASTPSYKTAPESIASVAVPVESEADISIQTANNSNITNKKENSSNIFSDAGIEVMYNKPNTISGSQPKVIPLVEKSFNTVDRFMESGIDVIPEHKTNDVFIPNPATRVETLSGINNPTTSISSILGDKLGKTTITPTTQSNQSLVKDPYKEQIG